MKNVTEKEFYNFLSDKDYVENIISPTTVMYNDRQGNVIAKSSIRTYPQFYISLIK